MGTLFADAGPGEIAVISVIVVLGTLLFDKGIPALVALLRGKSDSDIAHKVADAENETRRLKAEAEAEAKRRKADRDDEDHENVRLQSALNDVWDKLKEVQAKSEEREGKYAENAKLLGRCEAKIEQLEFRQREDKERIVFLEGAERQCREREKRLQERVEALERGSDG